MRRHGWIWRTVAPLLAVLVVAAAAAAPASSSRSQGSSPGLWLVADNGRIQPLGSAGGVATNDAGWSRRHAIVAAASTPTGAGLWVAADDGRVFAFGDAVSYGGPTTRRGPARAAAIGGTPDGRGYLLAFEDGQVQAYGDAVSHGSATIPRGEHHEIVGVALTPSGAGYWLAGADGQVYAFGDATQLGSAGHGRGDDTRVVAVAATPTGRGLWLAYADGRIVALGDAPVLSGAPRGHGELVGIASTPSGRGLWLAEADGPVDALGDATPLAGPGRDHGLGRVVAVASSTPSGSLTVTVTNLPAGVAAAATATGAGAAFGIPATETLKVAAGEYDVAAAAVDTGGTTYSPTVAGSPATVAPGAGASATVDYFTAVPDTTKVVPKAAVEGATGDPATGVTLTLDAATAPRLAVGDVLGVGITPATPQGLLGRVTSVSAAGGTLTVQTTPATLMEAISRGDIDFDWNLAGGGTSASGAAASPKPRRTQGFSGFVVRIAQNVDCGGDAPISLTGDVTLTPDVKVKAHWGGFLHPTSVSSAEFIGSVTETARLALAAKAAAHCELSPTPLLPVPLSYTFDLQVGPFPVITTVQLQLELSAGGTISAAINTSVTQTLTARAGVTYDHGSFSPVADIDNSFSFVRPSPQANVALWAKVGPLVSLFFYGVGGPEVNLDAGLDFEADTATEPPTPWWTLAGTLEAGVGFRVPVINVEWSKPDLIAYRYVLAHATEPPPVPVEVTVTPEASAGDTVHVSGSGFGANETVDLLFGRGGPSLGTVRTDGSGSFSKAVDLPVDATEGDYAIVATGRRSGKTGSADISVVPPPTSLTVDPSLVRAGGSVTVSGGGFRAHETVELAFDPGGPSLGTATTDDSGAFSTTVTIPADTSEGPHTIAATGRTSHWADYVDVTVIPPQPAGVSVAPDGARPGGTVTVSGRDFRANETVDLTFDPDGASLGTVAADGTGSFSTTVTIPADAADGSHPVVATGRASGKSGSGSVYVSQTGGGPPPASSFRLTISTHQGLITETPCGTSCNVTLYADYGHGFVPVSGTITLGGTWQTVPTDSCPAYDANRWYQSICTYNVAGAYAFRLVSTEPVLWDAGEDDPEICNEPQIGTVCTVTDITAATYRFTANIPAPDVWGDPPAATVPPQLSGVVWTDHCGPDCVLPSPQWTAVVGSTLTVDAGQWTGDPSLVADWHRCDGRSCVDIGTGLSYTLTAADCRADGDTSQPCTYWVYADVWATNTHGDVQAYAWIDADHYTAVVTTPG